MKQAGDYREEAQCLADILEPLTNADYLQPTQFKGWTIEDVVGHLHLFDHAALLSLQEPESFQHFWLPLAEDLRQGKSFLEIQRPWLGTLSGRALLEAWRKGSEQLAEAFSKADPKARVAWAGPSMSARSSITARQMETWAHGHEIFDILGQTRTEADRIYNICHMGVATFGWTFKNRNQPIPECAPHVQLKSPSGAVWEWNSEEGAGIVSGQAVAFAQVVTQTRNIADTSLSVTGQPAILWMEIAQCFAGPPADPPASGTRFKV